MKRIYLAIQVDCTMQNDYSGKPHNGGKEAYYAYVLSIGPGEEVTGRLDHIGGLKVAHLCESRKQATETVTARNEAFRRNGTYAFDTPLF